MLKYTVTPVGTDLEDTWIALVLKLNFAHCFSFRLSCQESQDEYILVTHF